MKYALLHSYYVSYLSGRTNYYGKNVILCLISIGVSLCLFTSENTLPAEIFKAPLRETQSGSHERHFSLRPSFRVSEMIPLRIFLT